MFKKLAIATIVMATSASTFANIAAPYLSLDAGVNHQLFENKSGTTVDFGGTGGLFNLSGGFGSLVNSNVYLGGEAFINTTTDNVDAIKSDDVTTLKYKTKYSYGVSFIPGYVVSPNTMLYARLGIVKSRFNVKIDVPNVVDENENHNVTGGQFGLGLQTALNEKVFLRTEYTYTDYKSFTAFDTKVNATSGQATVGLLYKFG